MTFVISGALLAPKRGDSGGVEQRAGTWNILERRGEYKCDGNKGIGSPPTKRTAWLERSLGPRRKESWIIFRLFDGRKKRGTPAASFCISPLQNGKWRVAHFSEVFLPPRVVFVLSCLEFEWRKQENPFKQPPKDVKNENGFLPLTPEKNWPSRRVLEAQRSDEQLFFPSAFQLRSLSCCQN